MLRVWLDIPIIRIRSVNNVKKLMMRRQYPNRAINLPVLRGASVKIRQRHQAKLKSC
jgi:hypothetical protein